MESQTRFVTTHTTGSKVTHLIGHDVHKKIEQHPCYSSQAHQYARMHLPVAPACNIQCNYCNRKYDCSNESRPGVVSKVMDVPAAVSQFTTIKKRAQNLSVVGIAGPGDALANPQATFATLRQIHKADPKAQLCISTNGLALAENVEKLAQLGVNHLTITINTIDPEIGAKIYPWIYFNHKRIRGVEASEILIERQLEGLTLAVNAGMLVKVNTVLIPGINDEHISVVSAAVKERGALLHNIMPLISDPSHGTFFGLSGQRGPTEEEVATARQASGNFMPQMTHCQQCRADAVGTLGGGCSSESNEQDKSTYTIAVARDNNDQLSIHFGHARQFEIYQYQLSNSTFSLIERRNVDLYCNGANDCDENIDSKDAIIEAVSDCDYILCARIGISPWKMLEQRGVTPVVDYAYQNVSDALSKLAQQLENTVEPEAEYDTCHNE